MIFPHWYWQFVDLWYPQSYLLDDNSKEACIKLHSFLHELTDKHIELLQPANLKALTQEQLLTASEELKLLLFETHESLQEFLKHGIEDS